MKMYSFEELTDFEFQNLVNHLLSVVNTWNIESFKPGRDRGIDGRVSIYGETIIIQSKHYRKSGLKVLLTTIKNEELQKVKKLSPGRYIFATSLNLNPDDKERILVAYSGVNLKLEDIIGNNELNTYLAKHPEILKYWYKLWAESSEILQLFSHPEIISREITLKERLNRINKVFVETEDVSNAIKLLKEKHVVVIAGDPGVGKTTLAEYLCQIFLKEEFTIEVIETDIHQHPFNFSDKTKKVLYYFDDFLGSNYLNAISGNQDSSIVRLIEHISLEPNKCLILTSRTNIISKASYLSQAFRSFNLPKKQYVINVNNYSKLVKAKMLYNHLWHSHLDIADKQNIIKDKFWKKIIEHRNFNPRLISFVLERDNFQGKDICSFILQQLENPEQIWDHCYSTQIDEYARILIKLCVANGGKIKESLFQNAFKCAVKEYGAVPSSNVTIDFQSTVRVVCGSFLNKIVEEKSSYYTHFNPSVSDYVINHILVFDEAKKLIDSLQSRECIIFYRDLVITNKIEREDAITVIDHLFTLEFPFDHEFNVLSLDMAAHLRYNSEWVKKYVDYFNNITVPLKFSTKIPTKFLMEILSNGHEIGVSERTFLLFINVADFDQDELVSIYHSISQKNYSVKLLETLKKMITTVLSNNIQEVVSGHEDFYTCVDEEDVQNHMHMVLNEIPSQFPMLGDHDLQCISQCVNKDDLFDLVIERMNHEEFDIDRDGDRTYNEYADMEKTIENLFNEFGK